MNVIISLCRKILIDSAPTLIMAIFIYRNLFPKYSAKFGVLTPIVYAVCIILFRIILNEIGEPGTLLKEIIHIIGIELSFPILSVVLFGGNKKGIILKTIICGFSELVVEIIIGEFLRLFFYFDVHLQDGYALPEVYISKILFFPILYISFLVWEMQMNRERLTGYIVWINIIIALLQFFILFRIIQKNFPTFEENGYIMTIISNVFLLLGYFIVMEVFRELIRQQEKENEMEKMKSERRYQYNYYQLAQRQGEEIRDIRHDLRNQLQTIQYMLKSGDEQGAKAGKEMLEKLKKRVNHLE